MRLNVAFCININEDFYIDDLKEVIFDTFKHDFDVIFQGKKIRPGQEINKINKSKNSKIFLMFSKFKARKANSSISVPKTIEKFINKDEKTDSINSADFSKTSKEGSNGTSKAKEIEITSKIQGHQEAVKIEADQYKTNSSPETNSKAQIKDNQELHNSETHEVDLNQSKFPTFSNISIPTFPNLNLSIKQAAEQWVSKMASDIESRGYILRIGKDPSYYDEFVKQSLFQHPNNKPFFTSCKFLIIKLCQKEVYKFIFNQEAIPKDIEHDYANLDFIKIQNYYNLGQKEEALDFCNKSIKMNPNDGNMRSLKIAVLKDLGRNDEAYDAYNEAIKTNLHPTNSYYWRGIVLKLLGRKVEALSVVSRGITIWPNEATLLTLMGEIFYDLDDREEAIKYFISAFKIDWIFSIKSFHKTFPDAKKIFQDQFPEFSIKKGLKCNICNTIFTGNDTQYLCLYCNPNHYHCDNCEKNIKLYAKGSAKFAHPHSTFVIHPKTRELNKLKFGASTHENIEFPSDQENKIHKNICNNSNSGYCDGEINDNLYMCARCINFHLCEGCQNKFLDGEIKTANCLKHSGHKIWHVMIKMKIP